MTIDSVVESLAEAIDRALILYDTDLNVVAYSAHSGDVDQARRAAILTRRGTSRARAMMRSHGAASNIGPLRLPEEVGMPERIVYPVRHDGYVLGYLVYVEPGAPGEVPLRTRTQLDRHATELGGLLLVRDLDREQSRVRLRMLMSDVVSDDAVRRSSAARSLVTDELLPAATEYTGVVLVPLSIVGVPTADQRSTLEGALLSLSRSARRPVVGAVIEGAALVVMAGRGDANAFPARLQGREAADVRMGIGAPVAELTDVAASVRQARIAARACILDPGQYPARARWDQLGLDRLLLQLPLDQITVDDLPVSVARLLDASAGPDLAATVEAYLDCAGEAQATAARLMIHRSTFYYRLDRAREVTGVDLHDGAVRRDLHTGLRVARLAGLT